MFLTPLIGSSLLCCRLLTLRHYDHAPFLLKVQTRCFASHQQCGNLSNIFVHLISLLYNMPFRLNLIHFVLLQVYLTILIAQHQANAVSVLVCFRVDSSTVNLVAEVLSHNVNASSA